MRRDGRQEKEVEDRVDVLYLFTSSQPSSNPRPTLYKCRSIVCMIEQARQCWCAKASTEKEQRNTLSTLRRPTALGARVKVPRPARRVNFKCVVLLSARVFIGYAIRPNDRRGRTYSDSAQHACRALGKGRADEKHTGRVKKKRVRVVTRALSLCLSRPSSCRRRIHLALPALQLERMTNTAQKVASSAGRALRLGMMPADGIGREVLPCAARVLQATPGAPKFDFVHLDAGFEHFQKHGTALPEETVRTLKSDCDGAMFGSVSSPSHKVEGYSSPIVKLRKELDLYANIRPVIGVRGTRDDEKWVDTVIVRENTECLYIKSETIEQGSQGQVARAIRQISERASKRIGKKAFEVALAREQLRAKAGTAAMSAGKAKVTVCHKVSMHGL